MRRNHLDLIKASTAETAAEADPQTATFDRPAAVAEQGAIEIAPGSPQRLDAYQAAVDAALATLAPMPTLEERTRYKRERALPSVAEFVEAYVSAGYDYPNSVAVQAVIWAFDAGDIDRGFRWGLALASQTPPQLLPSKFDRDLRTFVCDAVYDWANEELKADRSAAPYLNDLLVAIDAQGWQLHPAVHSKLLVMAAKHAERGHDYAAAIAYAERAQEVNPDGAGVKKLLERCRKAFAATDSPAG